MKKVKSITMAAITALTLLVGATESQAGCWGYQPVTVYQPVYVPTPVHVTTWQHQYSPYGYSYQVQTNQYWN